jgi:hypothetical protein
MKLTTILALLISCATLVSSVPWSPASTISVFLIATAASAPSALRARKAARYLRSAPVLQSSYDTVSFAPLVNRVMMISANLSVCTPE